MDELVDYLKEINVLKSPNIIKAFKDVDRADFIPEYLREYAYEDIVLPIGREQTISQPYVVAFMLELLSPNEGEKILDVGSGSGWTTALLGRIAGERGKVIGLDVIPELTEMGRKNLEKYNMFQARIELAKKMGKAEEAPFQKILVNASGAEIPEELIEQLAVGGRMVIPVKNSVWKIDKTAKGHIEKQEFPGFVFVPLIK